MDHLSHNAPVHWGYSGATANTTTTWPPMPTRSIKRPLSESDDCDDVFSEESSKEQCTSPGDSDSCQMLSRKKRRGVIEKKRRDRINTSLTELKKLVPSAYEKQGSAKLEKAEILQMTVDHLKMINAKGLDSLAYDKHKYAMDYHNIGFRECATEVARYLVTIEGMDIQDPLHLRLMSHLQCFAAQRELASKHQPAPAPWTYGSSQNYPLPSTAAPSHHHPSQSSLNTLHHHHPQNVVHHDLGSGHFPTDISSQPSTVAAVSSADTLSRLSTSQPPLPPSSSTTILTPLTPTTTSVALGYSPHQYPGVNSFTTPTTSHHQYNQTNSSAQMKPYRPWGAEVAY